MLRIDYRFGEPGVGSSIFASSASDGSGSVSNPEDLAVAAAQLWERRRGWKRMVVKLNEEFLEGNALLDLRPIQGGVAQRQASDSEDGWRRRADMGFQAKKRRIGPSTAFQGGDCQRHFVEGSEAITWRPGRASPGSEVEITLTRPKSQGRPDGSNLFGVAR